MVRFKRVPEIQFYVTMLTGHSVTGIGVYLLRRFLSRSARSTVDRALCDRIFGATEYQHNTKQCIGLFVTSMTATTNNTAGFGIFFNFFSLLHLLRPATNIWRPVVLLNLTTQTRVKGRPVAKPDENSLNYGELMFCCQIRIVMRRIGL